MERPSLEHLFTALGRRHAVHVLHELIEAPTLSFTELQHAIDLHPMRLNDLLNQLAAAGLAARLEDREGWRATEAGRDTGVMFQEFFERHQRSLIQVLGVPESPTAAAWTRLAERNDWQHGEEMHIAFVVEAVFELLARKHAYAILRQLFFHGAHGFSELRDALSITSKSLSSRLVQLEAFTVVDRSVVSEQPLRVRYDLSPVARILTEELDPMLLSLTESHPDITGAAP